jgi:hypothetical protein
MAYVVPEAVADGVIAAALEGRAIQNKWREIRDGKEFVCALAAFGPDINSPKDCPAEYMPKWLVRLIPSLDDGLASDRVVPFFIGLGQRAKMWSVLDHSAWDQVRVSFLIHCVQDALAEAESFCPRPRPEWFIKVEDACGLVLAALQGIGDLEVAAKAAHSAANDATNVAYSAAYDDYDDDATIVAYDDAYDDAYGAYGAANDDANDDANAANAAAAAALAAYYASVDNNHYTNCTLASNYAAAAVQGNSTGDAYQRRVTVLFAALDVEINK